jgi:hypothetical protein
MGRETDRPKTTKIPPGSRYFIAVLTAVAMPSNFADDIVPAARAYS